MRTIIAVFLCLISAHFMLCQNGSTALHCAAHYDQVGAAGMLLKHGADIEARTGHGGSTPLHIACSAGNTSIVKLLLKHKANIQAETTLGLTPLGLARKHGHRAVMNLLWFQKSSITAAWILDAAQDGVLQVVQDILQADPTAVHTRREVRQPKYLSAPMPLRPHAPNFTHAHY